MYILWSQEIILYKQDVFNLPRGKMNDLGEFMVVILIEDHIQYIAIPR